MRLLLSHRWGLIGLASALVFWAGGRFVQPPPALLAAALLLSLVASAGAIAAARRPDRSSTFLGLLTCLIILSLDGLFLSTLFWAGPELGWTRQSSTNAAPSPPASPAGLPDSLTLVTFNVQHRYPGFLLQEERYQALLEELREIEPDVVVLQEAWRTRTHGDLTERLATELGMQAVFAPANGSLRYLGFEEGGAVLSRWPILEAEVLQLLPRRPFWARRIALTADLAIGPTTLKVVGAHLALGRNLTVRDQAIFLADWARDRGTHVVLGDLNSLPDSDVVAAFESRGFSPAAVDRVDYILTSGALPDGWWIEETGTILTSPRIDSAGSAIELSDHNGLFLRLRSTP